MDHRIVIRPGMCLYNNFVVVIISPCFCLNLPIKGVLPNHVFFMLLRTTVPFAEEILLGRILQKEMRLNWRGGLDSQT
jgi:hypothetical protein